MGDNRLEIALKYIQENLKIVDLLKSYNRYGDEVDRGSYVMIPCPFHKDDSPSFGIKIRENWCNCFSCGAGGSYITLFRQLYKAIYYSDISIYRAVDLILGSDSVIAGKLGFISVSENEIIKVDSSFKSKRLLATPVKKLSLTDLSYAMRKSNLISFESVALAQALLFQMNQIPDKILEILQPVDLSDSYELNPADRPSEMLSAADLLKGVAW